MFSGFKYKLFFFLLSVLVALPFYNTIAQCVGLPSVSSLGSNKFPVGLCSPVQANVTYNVSFTSPVAPGTLELVYDWGDGSKPEIVPWATGSIAYKASLVHQFPTESDCEYLVTITVRYNGVLCSTTRQLQKIASWRTDAFNGGSVRLVSPVAGTSEHLVCEGADIDVRFVDDTNWNCNGPAAAIESPNIENRWQQIVYNNPVVGSKIPNIEVDGVALTDGNGNDIRVNYQDPRGVYYMVSPVVFDDTRRRPSLRITAPGGLGTGFPKAGDVFELTLRYWNFCNPYDDPNIPGPPSDVINGDHAPVERTAVIKIKAVPAAPVATNTSVCSATTPTSFSVTGVPTGSVVNWYANVTNPDRPGALISSGTSTSLPVTNHPEWVNNTTPGVYKLWASYEPKVAGAVNCESPKVIVTRSIREALAISEPVSGVPTELCNNTTVTINMPAAEAEDVGGATQYIWTGSSGVTVASSTATSATFNVKINSFGASMSVNRTITVNRRYTTTPNCSKSKTFTIKVYTPPTGGTLSTAEDVCATSPVGEITLSNYFGKIIGWEVKKDEGAFAAYSGVAAENSIFPGVLPHGTYTFRAVVENGPCAVRYSNEETVNVFATAATPVYAGSDQFVCGSFSSSALGASNPSPGTGVWTYISSVPQNLPPPTFLTGINDPNTSIAINSENPGAYTLRWTVTNGLCSAYDDIVVDFGTTPTDPNAGPDKSVCGPVASLEGNVPEAGLGRWTVVSGPGGCIGTDCPLSIASADLPSASAQLVGTVYTYGAYVLRWSITSGGNNCFAKYDDVTIQFDEPAQVNASDVPMICLDPNNLAPVNLSGTLGGSGRSGEWINVSGFGTISASTVSGSVNATVTATYTPDHNDYMVGLPIQVKLVSRPDSKSACPAAEKIINIAIDRRPIARAGDDILNICGDTVKLNAENPLPYGATGIWTTNQSGLLFDDATDPETIVRNLPAAPSQSIITWTLTSASGLCVATPASIKLARASLPGTVDINPTECSADPSGEQVFTHVILTNYENSVTRLTSSEREVTWYKDATTIHGKLIANPSVAQTNVQSGQVYVARVRDTRTQCTSDATVTINIRPLPQAADAIFPLCEDVPGENSVSNVDLSQRQYKAAVSPETNVDITWHMTESDAQKNLSAISTPLRVVGKVQVHARIAYRDAAPYCYNLAKLNLVVSPRPTNTMIFGREAVCAGGTSDPDKLPIEIYQVTPINGAKYYWEIPTGPSEFKVFGGSQESDFYAMLQFPNNYTGKIKVRVELNGCSGPVIEKQIAVSDAPVMPVIIGEQEVQENSSAVAYRVSPDNSPASSYNWEVHKASDLSEGGAHIVEGQSTGNILVNFLNEDVILSARESNSACVSPVATLAIAVRKDPVIKVKASFTTNPLAACAPARIALNNTSAGADTFFWKVYNAGVLVTTSKEPEPVFTLTNTGLYDIYLVASASRTGRVDSTQFKGITVYGAPQASFKIRSTLVYTPETEVHTVNEGSPATQYQWDFGDGFTSSEFEPRHAYSQPGHYTITLTAFQDYGSKDTDGDGVVDTNVVCYDSAHQNVTAVEGSYIEIPNAFTPSRSGPSGGIATNGSFNDVFLPITKGVVKYNLQIFDRWGTLVFETDNKEIGWDGYDRSGKLMPASVYVYKIIMDLSDGQHTTRMGDVTLLR